MRAQIVGGVCLTGIEAKCRGMVGPAASRRRCTGHPPSDSQQASGTFGGCTMRLFLGFVAAAAAAWGSIASAQDGNNQPPKADVVNATYMVQGLHCGPCATTVQRSLKKVKGVKSIKVDFKTKAATISFDEIAISAQEIARALSDTPHMMGGDMQYGGALVLSVASLKHQAIGQKARDALSKVEGVSKVTLFPKQEAVSVEFSDKGNVTSKHLIEALNEVGLKGRHYGSGDAKHTSAAARPLDEDERMAMNGAGNHAGMRMGASGMASTRMGGNGDMEERAGMGQRMGCGMAMMGMDDMDGPDPQPVSGRYVPPARSYYPGRAIGSGGCGCCR